jgi:hypothetical protein
MSGWKTESRIKGASEGTRAKLNFLTMLSLIISRKQKVVGSKSLFSLLLITTLTIGLVSQVNASAIAGTKCPKVGIKKTYGNASYTCIKLGKNLYWNNGVSSKPEATKPTQSSSGANKPKIVNDFLSLIMHQDKAGSVYVASVLKEISSGKIFLSDDAIKWTTSFGQNFYAQDVWQNSILGCSNSAGCVQSTYVVKQNGNTATEISFASLFHPGTFAAPLLKEADFGDDENSVIAHIKFSAIDGASDLIVRYDISTKTITPIFVTYCVARNSKICSSGASISGLKVSHKTGKIYFVLNVGELDINNLSASQFLVSLPTSAPKLTIRNSQDATSLTWEGDVQKSVLYQHKDSSTTIDDVNVSASGNYIFLITRGKNDVGTNNGFCRISLTSLEPTCRQVEPFNFISSVINVNDNSFIYEGFSGIKYFDILTSISSPVYNTSDSTWLLDLTK